jgi:hypothetical protein
MYRHVLARYISDVRARDFPSPLRHFVAELDALRAANSLDMDRVGRLVVELAADHDYLGPLITEMPANSTSGTWLLRPGRGPRLVLFHRPEGVISCTHSHGCWVARTGPRG